MSATNSRLPDHSTVAASGFDLSLSRAVDAARTAYEAAIVAGDPNLILATGDELRQLESAIPEPER